MASPRTLSTPRIAFQAGTDMDMESRNYLAALPLLVREGLVDERATRRRGRRVLQLKEDLGLFDQPFGGPMTRSRKPR